MIDELTTSKKKEKEYLILELKVYINKKLYEKNIITFELYKKMQNLLVKKMDKIITKKGD